MNMNLKANKTFNIKTHAYVGYSVDAYDEDKIVFK